MSESFHTNTFVILGMFDCYTFDQMFPFGGPYKERFPVKSGEWTDSMGGVMLRGIDKKGLKEIVDHISLNGYKDEIKVLKITDVSKLL